MSFRDIDDDELRQLAQDLYPEFYGPDGTMDDLLVQGGRFKQKLAKKKAIADQEFMSRFKKPNMRQEVTEEKSVLDENGWRKL